MRDPVAWTASNRPVVIPLGTLKQAKMWKDHSFQKPDTTDGTYLTADDTVLDFGTRVGGWVTDHDESDVLTVTYTRDDDIPIQLKFGLGDSGMQDEGANNRTSRIMEISSILSV